MARLLSRQFLNNTWVAVLLPAFVGVAGAAFSINRLHSYGWVLFLGLPVLVTLLSAICFCWGRSKKFSQTYGVGFGSLIAVGSLLLLFGIDGLICLLMALPLATLLGLIGTYLGRWIARGLNGSQAAAVASALTALFPFLVSFEHSVAPEPKIRQVSTKVVVDAPIDEVWKEVIAFSEITDEPMGLFAMGIAYPIRAKIEGEGVGAIRYCTFSTGDFVEPITVWDEPHLLAFDVVESPAPMKELTFYDDLHAPHMHGHMRSHKGQFLLEEVDGKVVVEGTTWYSHDILPEFYWGRISDEIIHEIHRRVLEHIRDEVEARVRGVGGERAHGA